MKLALILLATQLAASPLLGDGDEPTSLQYWYTVSVPQESGVYEAQVFAPVLPALFAQPQIVVLDEALRLVETPEPGTFDLMVLAAAIVSCVYIPIVLYWRGAAKIARSKLYVCESHVNHYRQWLHMIRFSRADNAELREMARKALEE